MTNKPERREEEGSGPASPSVGAKANPLFLKGLYPDAQGLLDTRYASLEEMKETCLVVLDATAMLLPYVMGQVTLGKVIDVYRPLAQQARLIVPAQAAREFAKNRSTKIADIVQHLQNWSSAVVAPKNQHIGILAGDSDYAEMQRLCNEVGKLAKSIQSKVKVIAERISSEIGRDPVSEAYRDVLKGCVRDENEPEDEAAFRRDMEERYKSRRPPGYKDMNKSDGGAGDLIIWQTVLRAGNSTGRGCIFVTGDTKTDWYTQSNGAFQPRLELIEEYRLHSNGGSIQIIPLSRLMELYEAGTEAVADTKQAELDIRSPTVDIPPIQLALAESEWFALNSDLVDIETRIKRTNQQMASFGPEDFNTSLSLPWNRAAHGLRVSMHNLLTRQADIKKRLKELESLSGSVNVTPF